MPTASKPKKGKKEKFPEPSAQLSLIATKLDKAISRLDALTSLFLDFLLSDEKYENPIEYTDKAVRLNKMGLEIDVISGIVRHPSNYVSSRLRESEKRKYSRRRARNKKVVDSSITRNTNNPSSTISSQEMRNGK